MLSGDVTYSSSRSCSTPAGFTFGEKYYPTFDGDEREDEYVTSPDSIYCLATYINSYYQPVILGFLFPKETALSIPDYGMYLFRHESDVIQMIRGDGTVQFYHPSGSIIKIGSSDTDEISALEPAKTISNYIQSSSDYNAKRQTSLYIKWHAGQNVIIDSTGNVTLKTRDDAATITITPEGQITMQSTQSISASTDGAVSVSSGSNIDVVSSAIVNVTASQVNFIKG